MVVMIWSAVPLATILYMAGIQTINRELYEAGILDGANAFQLLRHITWPLLYPITVIIVITSINSAFQDYEMVYLMTGGGPAGHTEVVGLQVFEYGFGKSQQLGLASAMSWLLFLVVFIIALINLRFSGPKINLHKALILNIPGELIGIYLRIFLPLAGPAIATVSILNFVSTWNAFIWPSIVINNQDWFTLPLKLKDIDLQQVIQWNVRMAGSLITTIPLLIVFLILQRYYIRGITAGATKG